MYYKNRQEMEEDLIQIFANGCKDPEDFSMGVELEHFLVNRDDLHRRYYSEKGGVKEVLEGLVNQEGMTPTYINGVLLGAEDETMALSLEPGSQFELSLKNNPSILDLKEEYKQGLEKIYRVLDPMGLAMVRLSLDPLHSPEEVPIIPKGRYQIMTDYMGVRGKFSTSMMRLTCSLQLSLDYKDEEDFIKKYRVLTWMVPICYSLSDSAYLHKGKPVDGYNFRQEIWRYTDPDRTGILPGTFDEDFGWRTYASWLLDRPILFIPGEEGPVEVGSKTLEEVLETVTNQEEAQACIQHALSIVFPDVRLKNYLEFRVFDQVPPNWGLAFAGLVKGLLYDEDNLDRLYQIAQTTNEMNIDRGKDAGRDNGLQGYYSSDYFAHWGIRLSELAQEGLDKEERPLVQTIPDGMNRLENPRYLFEQNYRDQGLEEAIRALMVFPNSL